MVTQAAQSKLFDVVVGSAQSGNNVRHRHSKICSLGHLAIDCNSLLVAQTVEIVKSGSRDLVAEIIALAVGGVALDVVKILV